MPATSVKVLRIISSSGAYIRQCRELDVNQRGTAAPCDDESGIFESQTI